MLFNLFINDFANNINNEQCGVEAGIDNVSILLYADDIVLLSESPDKLQQFELSAYMVYKIENIHQCNQMKSCTLPKFQN